MAEAVHIQQSNAAAELLAPLFAELGGEFVLRLAIGAASTQMRHIDSVWNLLCVEADKLLQ